MANMRLVKNNKKKFTTRGAKTVSEKSYIYIGIIFRET